MRTIPGVPPCCSARRCTGACGGQTNIGRERVVRGAVRWGVGCGVGTARLTRSLQLAGPMNFRQRTQLGSSAIVYWQHCVRDCHCHCHCCAAQQPGWVEGYWYLYQCGSRAATSQRAAGIGRVCLPPGIAPGSSPAQPTTTGHLCLRSNTRVAPARLALQLIRTAARREAHLRSAVPRPARVAPSAACTG